jgi:serine/threonine-protein kinase
MEPSSSEPPPPPAGAIAGRYVLLDQVGHGAMGTVWRAWDVKTKEHVAAKVLSHHSGSMLLRFVREQGVRVQHPHVVAPTSWAAEDDVVVFTMDLVRGGSLATLLAEHGPLPEAYVALLLDQLLAALGAVHAAGVVHRDVKPANVLLEATGPGRPHLRLGDFGVAVPLDDARLTHVPGIVGTDGYMPPEQAAGARPDPRQDLYAAGVVAIECLTGRAPGPGRPAPPPGRLQPLLLALTEPDPGRRPATAAGARSLLPLPVGEPWRSDPHPPVVRDRMVAPAATQTRIRPPVRLALPPEELEAEVAPPGFAVDPIAAEALQTRMARRVTAPVPADDGVPDVPGDPGPDMRLVAVSVLVLAVLLVVVLSR